MWVIWFENSIKYLLSVPLDLVLLLLALVLGDGVEVGIGALEDFLDWVVEDPFMLTRLSGEKIYPETISSESPSDVRALPEAIFFQLSGQLTSEAERIFQNISARTAPK